MNNIKKITLKVLIIGILFTSSCTSLTPGLLGHSDFESNSTQYLVEGKNVFFKKQEIKVGNYYTDEVSKRENIKKDGDDESLTTAIEKKVKIDFTLFNTAKEEVYIDCEYYAGESNLHLGDWSITGDNDESYYVTIESEDAFTDFEFDGASCGFSIGSQSFRLYNEDKFDSKEKKSFNGYIIKEDNQTIAAIDINNNGKIWLHNSLDSKLEHHLSGILIAMLLKPELDSWAY